ncbi:ultraviolet-B receptor UVR8 [Aristolochia californica]|uniref:ultraviolet-B receptor UVR8 n=1 Tax=Aristolochia californica TaxID=171875 RepID=UPI0035DACAA4
MEDGEEEKKQTIWSWGAGSDGQLSTGSLDDKLLPQSLRPFPATPVIHIACGGAHAIALCGGRVLTWGRGTAGQLGHGDSENCLFPKPVKFFEGLLISHVSAGWNHSGFVSDNGSVFTCGDGSFGQLGHGEYLSQHSPVRVSFFALKFVQQIACGMRHTLVLEKGPSNVSVYGFGLGRRGQIGLSTDKTRRSFNVPQVISGFEECEIVSIHANGDHSAALCDNGYLYTWGRGFSGSSDVHIPQHLFTPLKFSQVAVGWNHALLLTVDGAVFMLGGVQHGMLAQPQLESRSEQAAFKYLPSTSSSVCRSPVLVEVPGLVGKKVRLISAGAEHSAVVTEDGLIMTWGWGEHGQLGLGNTLDQTSPQTVPFGDSPPSPYTELHVYCGSGFTYAVRSVSKHSQ